MEISDKIINHYENINNEHIRHEGNPVEKLRTQEIISRYIQSPSEKILDVGGGTGIYSFWLHDLGHELHMVDIVPTHVEQAKKIAVSSERQLGSILLGDARQLNYEDGYFDMVLMLGPLYHLTEAEDRQKALKEAKRVLKPGGVILGAGITQFATLYDGYFHDLVQDPEFVPMMVKDVETGQHRPTKPGYFTDVIFHHPDLLKREFIETGFANVELIGIDAFTRYVPDILEKCTDPKYVDLLMNMLEKIEKEKTLIGSSSHIMAVGKKNN
jgi:ubiquinone/menaquinone biosynthesis C-methylase UbiE